MGIITHLVVETYGAFVGKHSERLIVSQKGVTLAKAPLLQLETVHILERGISFSADALEVCCERGIPVFFVSPDGQPYASVYAPGLSATVITRREQLRAYDDERGSYLARCIAAAKIHNQANTLKYLAKHRKETPAGDELKASADAVMAYLVALDRLPEAVPVEAIRAELMGLEGNAARVYWQAARQIVPEEYGWTTRETRGARDPMNSLLNYGYGILYGQIERALVLAGLDPYAGFIHADRPGKPSLVLDFIEEFRQIAIDRVVFGLVTRQFNVEQDEHGMMLPETRKTYAEHVLSHLEAGVRYKGDRHPLRHVIQSQARHLAAYLRGDCADYLAFNSGW